MKIFRHLILAIASLAIFSSCAKEEEKLVATAIMTDKASLEFGIEDPLMHALTVYADAPWTVETPSWITVDPARGEAGETVVTVTVQPNIREELPDRPRQDVITFIGQDMYANATVDILQAGDKYRDLAEVTLAEALSYDPETFVGVKDVQVVALTSDGFIAKDETAMSYVAAEQEVAVGDKGNVYSYVASFNGMPSLNKTDKVVMTSNSPVDYSSAKDITATLQAYDASEIELISIKGKYASKKIELYYEEGEAQPVVPDSIKVEIVNPHESVEIAQYDGWLVDVKGYTVGKGSNVVYVVPVTVEGVKSLEKIYYSDDFSWIAPMSAADAAGDAVTDNNPSTTAPNVWKMTSSADFFAKFNEIGYQYLYSTVGDKEFKPGPAQEPNGAVDKTGSMYIQKDYLKFGQTSYNGAIQLPALAEIDGTANIQIDFDWCWQVTGAYKPDLMTLTVESSNGMFETGLLVSDEIESAQSQVDGESAIEWQHASVILTGATADTRLTIRPTYADPTKQNPSRKQNRWYLDNVKIVEYTGSVTVAEPTEAEVSISMENSMTFEAAQTEPIAFTFESDQEATLSIEADWVYFLAEDNSTQSSITIPAATPTVVNVACAENTTSDARKAEIVIVSGLTTKTIPVTQVSPGVKLEPFISLVGGNAVEFEMAGGEYSMTVQSNVDFEYVSTCDWMTIEAVPATKAMVDYTSFVVTCAANEGDTRNGAIRVYNSAKNLETVLNVTQKGLDGPKMLASFPFPYDTAFTGEGEGAGTWWNLAEGWLLSEDGFSKMSAHNADDSQLKVTYKYEASSDGGVTKDHVRILATGMVKDGYWLFEVPVKDMPAGTYNITYNQSASATGPNYFLVEVSVDGQNWAPAGAQTTTETYVDGTGGREVTWTYALNRGGVNAANIAYTVDVDYVAPELPGENTIYVRAKVADDMAYGSTKALGTKGTNRIWGPCEVTFTK